MFCAALPPADFAWLGWFAFVPLLMAVRGKGFLVGFSCGLLAMFACAFLAKSGVFYAEKDFSGEPGWLYTGCFLFGFAVAILSGVWADRAGSTKPLWWFAALAVCLEAVLLIQLPAHLALTQYRQPALLFLASLGGIWLVSFLLWLSNLAIATALLSKRYLAALVLPAVWLLIGVVQGQVKHEVAGSYWSVAVVQTEATDEETLRKLHMTASRRRNLVVWPEFAGLALAPAGNTLKLRELAAVPGSAPFVTSFNDDFQPLPHNAASLFSLGGESERYFKRHLFGGEKSMHTPGKEPAWAALPEGKIGLTICFDSCYPSEIRERALNSGTSLIALPTIDPQSPHHLIAALHAAFTPFRAAENGIPIARSDGFGHSMVVDSDGFILAELNGGEAITGAHVSAPYSTVYRRFGDWFLWLCVLGVAIGIVASFFYPRR